MSKKKIVAYIPFGREETVSILFPYMERDWNAGVIDELMLCMNTEVHQESDRAYAYKLALEHDWVNTYERPGSSGAGAMDVPPEWLTGPLKPKQLNTGRFFFYMQDPDTTYIRMDDDIVWVAPHAIENMVARLGQKGRPLAVFPVIWNNAVSTWWLQKEDHFLIPEEPRVSRNAVDPIGWGSPKFAGVMHDALLTFLESGADLGKLNMDATYTLPARQQFSVSSFAISGKEYEKLNGVIDYPEEEHWLTQFKTTQTSRSNIIAGDAWVSHFSFYPQREYLLRKTDALERYRALAEEL